MNDYFNMMFLFYALLIAIFIVELIVVKKEKYIYKTKNSIKEKVFPLIQVELMETLSFDEIGIKEKCLAIIDANIVKTKYTDDLSCNINISSIDEYNNTRKISIEIINNKKALFNNVHEKVSFFITNKNGNIIVNNANSF